jgi:hypothetical protein
MTSELWEISDKPAHNDDPRWVKIAVEIRCNSTGEVRSFGDAAYIADGESSPVTYHWASGNYGCDCNRHLQFRRANNEDDGEPIACGQSAYAVRLTNPTSGRVFYDEFGDKEHRDD